ncbi:GH36-type glycosyl hydrolase domain-containing protein [Paenibacillus lentus]|uniref:Glycosyl transferase n=1 Tax=Paenibacillus lentus TaxID=1338368 RepID=A0A3S8RSK6_9BACL|nr:amylo-alpha-1,6-glucosidase [Paenibacillus lentus]AZK46085.1 glycosyl transferase [Paenibacillus lentus]
MYSKLVAREVYVSPEEVIREKYGKWLPQTMAVDALFMDTAYKKIVGVAGLPYKAPVVLELLKDGAVAAFFKDSLIENPSLLIIQQNDRLQALALNSTDGFAEIEIPAEISDRISEILASSISWAGYVNEAGEHIIDLRTPSPGPHFHTNLLVGNRIGFPRPLQTTPKSVIDRLGGGSFRSHAATQVLATRWDMRQEENGFPANRQFYLVEDGKQIFYSADPKDDNVTSAICTHAQNFTKIEYTTRCGLKIERLIFLLPQKEGMPLATEVQQIKVSNAGNANRKLKIIYTGMFGSANPHALFEDVLYSNIIMQTGLLLNEDQSIVAVTPDYYSDFYKEDVRFHSMLVDRKGDVEFPQEFCTNYNEFVGNGSLYRPEGVNQLSNRLYRKGPGFFALAADLSVEAGDVCQVRQFTGIVSSKLNDAYSEETVREEIHRLIEHFRSPGQVEEALKDNISFLKSYNELLCLRTEDELLNTYVNRNLPFQVFYQTFVSRSLCQTQKGYREIGFREIQDLFASMYYFLALGMEQFVKDMLKEWGSKVFEFGYAYHNFYWEGKEPGKWSDDALWLIQAVARYTHYTGDYRFLDEKCDIAGTSPVQQRSIYQTIQAIIQYSGQISIGKHGLPLLDLADWNDCLKLDQDCIDGITKERLYKEQVASKGISVGDEPFESHYSESVMNAFLLKMAVDEMQVIASAKGDQAYAAHLSDLSNRLQGNIQQHAWKENFFARVLFNRYENYSYLGAKGDGLSADPSIDGTYFINSFSWSILADSASEEQIEKMLDVVEKVLVTPYGIKLMSPANMGKIARFTATGEYFPGDRENGAIFKHASMMAVSAMLKAAKSVKDVKLAARLSDLAYWMLDLTLPYRTMESPYVTCGNPRFCTQYNNSETGENVGPIVSGTSTWLTLSLMSALGIEFTSKGLVLDPILREKEQEVIYDLKVGEAEYRIEITKPAGFYRVLDSQVSILLDGKELSGNVLPLDRTKASHVVKMQLQ